jgi:GntR family transcriptional regulator
MMSNPERQEGSILLPIELKSHLPIYQQVKNHILKSIQQGELLPDERLPAERKLAEEMSVSRMTVRRALNELIQEGRIYTKPGLGTFVAEPRLSRRVIVTSGFSEDLRKSGFTVTSKVFEKGVQHASADVAALLKLPPRDQVVFLERLRQVDGEPFAYQKAYLPKKLCPDLHTLDFTDRSLYATMRERYDLWMERADLTLEANEPSQREQELLELAPGVPVLVMVRISYLANDVPIEYIRSAYRGDKYTFSLSLKE